MNNQVVDDVDMPPVLSDAASVVENKTVILNFELMMRVADDVISIKTNFAVRINIFVFYRVNKRVAAAFKRPGQIGDLVVPAKLRLAKIKERF